MADEGEGQGSSEVTPLETLETLMSWIDTDAERARVYWALVAIRDAKPVFKR